MRAVSCPQLRSRLAVLSIQAEARPYPRVGVRADAGKKRGPERICFTLSGRITFLYTNSYDGTSDLIVRELGPENVFRFNFDLWGDYELAIEPGSFEARDPSGRSVRLEDIVKVYWRKPIQVRELFPENAISAERVYAEEELWYAMRDLVNLLWQEGKVVLVEPLAENRVGKFVQMRVAEGLFEVPPWKFIMGSPGRLVPDKESVVKSLTLGRVAERSVIYATKVREEELNPDEPWFVQDCVEAEADVTVVFVRGRLFPFELRRDFTDLSVDWRVVSLDPQYSKWVHFRLPAPTETAIREYMGRLSLDYGRLDFLRRPTGEYVFLEVNPHGEWGWLDPKGKIGVLGAIINEVSPLTPIHPLPVTPSFAMRA